MNFVIDTHILIWYFIGSRRLKKSAKETIDKCLIQGGILFVPTIVLSECLDIYEKRKVEYDFEGMLRLIRREPAFEIVGFSQEIFDETLKVKDIKEIHDRIIVATARFLFGRDYH